MKVHFLYDKNVFEAGMVPILQLFCIAIVMYYSYLLYKINEDDIKWFFRYSNPISKLIRNMKRKKREKDSFEWDIYDYIKEKKSE